MDPKLQTNFIPRKSAVDSTLPKRTPVGLFTLLAFSVFILAILTGGSLFFYKKVLEKQNTELFASLESFKQQTKQPIVYELIALKKRIDISTEKLSKHVAVSRVLTLLSEYTLQDVRWSNFAFEVNDAGAATLTMNGQARTFAAVALQMDKISADKDNFRNALVSDIRLDQNGNPMFTFKADIVPGALLYKTQIINTPQS